MTYREARMKLVEILQEAGIEEAAHESLLLLEYAASINQTEYLLHSDEQMEQRMAVRLMADGRLRASHCPLQYITGEQEFMGLPFRVNPDVLIPRQDTELLVEKAQSFLKTGDAVLDLCTGSGCIAVSIAHERPDVRVTAADLSRHALDTARQNAALNGCDVMFAESDLFDALHDRYDLIVSNPPYIRRDEIPSLMPEVSRYEPAMALDGGEDGLDFYRIIIAKGRRHLVPGGHLCLEIGCDQAAEVSALLAAEGYTDIRVHKDYADLDRVVTACTGQIEGDWNV